MASISVRRFLQRSSSATRACLARNQRPATSPPVGSASSNLGGVSSSNPPSAARFSRPKYPSCPSRFTILTNLLKFVFWLSRQLKILKLVMIKRKLNRGPFIFCLIFLNFPSELLDEQNCISYFTSPWPHFPSNQTNRRFPLCRLGFLFGWNYIILNWKNELNLCRWGVYRLPVELASALSMMPLHSATASALLNSMLSSKVGSWGWLSEGIYALQFNILFCLLATIILFLWYYG